MNDARATTWPSSAGDHIYKMNVAHMLQQHVAQRADLTIAAYPVPVAEATASA